MTKTHTITNVKAPVPSKQPRATNKSLLRKPARKAKPARTKPRMVPMALVHAVCAVTDPFCPHALRGQWYTGSRVRTMPYQLHTSTFLTTNVAGTAAILVLPAYNNFLAVSTSVTATTGLFGTINGTTSTPTPIGYRITSLGLIVRRTIAPMNASGMVRIRTFNSPIGSTLGNIDLSTYNCAEYSDVPLATSDEIAIIARISDTSKASSITDPSTTNTTTTVPGWVSPGWTPIVISVTGAAASTVVGEVEILINYELVFSDDNSMALLSSQTPHNSPVMQAITDTTSSTVKTIVVEGVKSFSGMVLRKVTQAAATYFGGPAAGAAVSSAMAIEYD